MPIIDNTSNGVFAILKNDMSADKKRDFLWMTGHVHSEDGVCLKNRYGLSCTPDRSTDITEEQFNIALAEFKKEWARADEQGLEGKRSLFGLIAALDTLGIGIDWTPITMHEADFPTTVCIAHGRFVPCRKGVYSECEFSHNPTWVSRVKAYNEYEKPVSWRWLWRDNK